MKQTLSTHHLYGLLFALAMVLATHAPNLPVWVIIASAGFGIWRYLLDKKTMVYAKN